MQYAGLRLVSFTQQRKFGVSAATASRLYVDLQTTSVVEAIIQGNDLQLRFFLMGVCTSLLHELSIDGLPEFNI
jgi:hypothetical protein